MVYTLYGWTTDAINTYNVNHGMTEINEDDLYDDMDFNPFMQDLENDEIHLQDCATYITEGNNLKELKELTNKLTDEENAFEQLHVWDNEEEMWII